MPGDRHPGAPLIRRARPPEAADLRALAHRAKEHWPYAPAFLERVRPLLQLDADDVRRGEVWVLEEDGAVAGWHRVRVHDSVAELEDLWLEPRWIGTGRGRILFEHAADVARTLAARVLEWDAEPYAEGFYQAMGATVIGSTPSSVEAGRSLPRMRISLSGA